MLFADNAEDDTDEGEAERESGSRIPEALRRARSCHTGRQPPLAGLERSEPKVRLRISVDSECSLAESGD